MRKLIGCLVLVFMFMSTSQAAKLKWTAPTSGGDIGGYAVYYTDTDNGEYQWSKNAGDQTELDISVLNLDPGTYYFVVVAYNTSGESDYSNIVDYLLEPHVHESNVREQEIKVPGIPLNVRIVVEVEGVPEK